MPFLLKRVLVLGSLILVSFSALSAEAQNVLQFRSRITREQGREPARQNESTPQGAVYQAVFVLTDYHLSRGGRWEAADESLSFLIDKWVSETEGQILILASASLLPMLDGDEEMHLKKVEALIRSWALPKLPTTGSATITERTQAFLEHGKTFLVVREDLGLSAWDEIAARRQVSKEIVAELSKLDLAENALIVGWSSDRFGALGAGIATQLAEELSSTGNSHRLVMPGFDFYQAIDFDGFSSRHHCGQLVF